MIEVIGSILTILIIAIGMGYLISIINYVIDEQYLRIKLGAFTFRKIPISDFKNVAIDVTVGEQNWTNTIYIPTI